MRAISLFSLEAGTSSFWWRARMELRMRVRKSATGSVRFIHSPSFPVRSASGHNSENQRKCCDLQGVGPGKARKSDFFQTSASLVDEVSGRVGRVRQPVNYTG